MAWHYVETKQYSPPGFTGTTVETFTDYQKDNIQEIVTKLSSLGYTLNAIAAIICNMVVESYLNPGQYEGTYNPSTDKGGFGLCQWTNAGSSTINLTLMRQWFENNGFSMTDGNRQLDFLNGMNNYIPGIWIKRTSNYLTWENFKVSTESPEWLARVFFDCFEWGTWIDRGKKAPAIYNYIAGLSPAPTPTPEPPTPPIPVPPSPEIYVRKKFPIYFYLRRQ